MLKVEKSDKIIIIIIEKTTGKRRLKLKLLFVPNKINMFDFNRVLIRNWKKVFFFGFLSKLVFEVSSKIFLFGLLTWTIS